MFSIGSPPVALSNVVVALNLTGVKSCPLPDISFPTRSLPSNGR